MFSKEKITIAYTMEVCPLCGMEKKREFKEGDILFSEMGKCSSCEGMVVIEKIFGETLE